MSVIETKREWVGLQGVRVQDGEVGGIVRWREGGVCGWDRGVWVG